MTDKTGSPAARALGCDEDEAALEEKPKAVLGSDQPTDAQVLDVCRKLEEK